ncbi:MAG: hypothetical protein OXI55_17670 [Gammaproteobacteria bacterium]|nr:hypothetical protein [Gammaproteobacteria bacterium]
MSRTTVELTTSEKSWLDREAERRRVSLADLVCLAVRELRLRHTAPEPAGTLGDVIVRTAGIRQGTDGLAFQEQIRVEWG